MRASAGAPRARIAQGQAFRDQPPAAGTRWESNPYEEFYAASADGVGLLDPGFDDWDLDPCVLVGLSPYRGDGREDG